MYDEYRALKHRAMLLKEITDTTRSAVKLVYDVEYQNSRGGNLKKSFARTLAKMIQSKAGGTVSDSDEDAAPIFQRKGDGEKMNVG
jgi:hypothetical protein